MNGRLNVQSESIYTANEFHLLKKIRGQFASLDAKSILGVIMMILTAPTGCGHDDQVGLCEFFQCFSAISSNG